MNDPLDTVTMLSPDVEPDPEALSRVRADLFATFDTAAGSAHSTTEHRGHQPRPGRRRAVRVLIPVAATVMVLAAAAATWMVARPSSETLNLMCPDRTIIPVASGNPVTDCVDHWQTLHDGTPPQMVAYDNGHGGVEVRFATEAVPEGNAEIDPHDYQDATVAELQDALLDIATGLPAACQGADGAISLINGEMDRLGMNDWSVVVEPDRAPKGADRCTSAYLEVDEKQAVIIDGGPSVDGRPAHPWEQAPFARELHETLDGSCMNLDEAEAVTRSLADATSITANGTELTIGDGMILSVVEDATADCARPNLQVGGAVLVTLRGPAS